MEANEPEKKMPSTAANATRRSPDSKKSKSPKTRTQWKAALSETHWIHSCRFLTSIPKVDLLSFIH